MSDSLTTIISKVQALLGDDGTIFTTATVTAAVRKALGIFNEHLPVYAADLIDAVTDQYEYELSDYDSRAMTVLDVLLYDDSGNAELHEPLHFDQYTEDERLFFRLRADQPTGEQLLVRYTIPHTVSGLDSETASSLPSWQDYILVTGSAAEALITRAYARVETINLNKDVSDNYKELAAIYKSDFLQAIRQIGSRKSVPVSQPERFAWNDGYHNWEQ